MAAENRSKQPGRFAAHDLSSAALGPGGIRIQDGQFIDSYGRSLHLRGVNVSGSSKLPAVPNGLSHLHEDFYETHRTVSFVGRPFPLSEAELHFSRLQAWGLPLIRLLVTWESLAHSGPNPDVDTDMEYIEYLTKLIELMPKYGLKCFICAHQDVWSRFSGGSGAPGWTFEMAGLDMQAFVQTGAAYVHSQDEKRKSANEGNGIEDDKKRAKDTKGKKQEPSGAFLWPSGYQKLAASTMATLFWGGDAFAPNLVVPRPRGGNSSHHPNQQLDPDSDSDPNPNTDLVGIQTILQHSYIESFGKLADAVRGLEACLGFEPINEPHRGLINLHDFHKWNYDTDLHIGHYPSFIEALALGEGYPQKIPFYVKSWPFPTRISHYSTVDPKGTSCWHASSSSTTSSDNADRKDSGGGCIWRNHGVWEWDSTKQLPVVLQYDYFEKSHAPGSKFGKKVEWYKDFYAPFLAKFEERMNRPSLSQQGQEAEQSRFLSFVEPIPNEFIPPWIPADLIRDEAVLREYTQASYAQKYSTKTLIDTPRPGGKKAFVYAPHFYDLNVLFSKMHSSMSVNVQGLSRGMFLPRALYFGYEGLVKNYTVQIGNLVNYALASLGNVPIIIGEVGIPMDINNKYAYRTGDYTKQIQLLNALISAMERNNVGFTLWNYNPDNRVEYGDGWNYEDFSITNGDVAPAPAADQIPSQDQQKNLTTSSSGKMMTIQQDFTNHLHQSDPIYQNGRCLEVIIRPYAVKTAGKLVRQCFDVETLLFELEWQNPPTSSSSAASASARVSEEDKEENQREEKARTTEIFLPSYHYKQKKFSVVSSDCEFFFDGELQTLYVTHTDTRPNVRHKLKVEIENVDQYRRDRVQRRRAYCPYKLWDTVVPIWAEVKWNAMSSEQVTSIVVVALLAILTIVGFDHIFQNALMRSSRESSTHHQDL